MNWDSETTTALRFFVFAYDTYYPTGGLNDLVGQFATLDEAATAASERARDHVQVVQWTAQGLSKVPERDWRHLVT